MKEQLIPPPEKVYALDPKLLAQCFEWECIDTLDTDTKIRVKAGIESHIDRLRMEPPEIGNLENLVDYVLSSRTIRDFQPHFASTILQDPTHPVTKQLDENQKRELFKESLVRGQERLEERLADEERKRGMNTMDQDATTRSLTTTVHMLGRQKVYEEFIEFLDLKEGQMPKLMYEK